MFFQVESDDGKVSRVAVLLVARRLSFPRSLVKLLTVSSAAQLKASSASRERTLFVRNAHSGELYLMRKGGVVQEEEEGHKPPNTHTFYLKLNIYFSPLQEIWHKDAFAQKCSRRHATHGSTTAYVYLRADYRAEI